MRHAEPERSEKYSDFEYPLTEQGVADAKYLATRLNDASVTIDKILASSTKRSSETAKLVASGLSCESIIDIKKLYLADWETIAEMIRGEGNDVNSILIVAHNPGVTEFIDQFADKVLTDWLRPCELVALELSCSAWYKFQSGIITATYLLDEEW